jgi:hypothetical protein
VITPRTNTSDTLAEPGEKVSEVGEGGDGVEDESELELKASVNKGRAREPQREGRLAF